MKKLLLLASTAGIFVGIWTAFADAADAPIPTKAPAIVGVASASQAGPYIVAFLGVGQSRNGASVDDPVTTKDKYGHNGCWKWSGCTNTSLVPTSLSTNPIGLLIGGGAGYNWYVMPRLALGVEGTLAFSTITGSATNGAVNVSQDIKALGFLGGRVIYDLAPNLAVYFKGGAAVANINFNTNVQGGTSNTKFGYGLGGGAEASIAQLTNIPGLAVRGEAMYYGFGHSTVPGGTASVKNDVLTITIGAVKHLNGI